MIFFLDNNFQFYKGSLRSSFWKHYEKVGEVPKYHVSVFYLKIFECLSKSNICVGFIPTTNNKKDNIRRLDFHEGIDYDHLNFFQDSTLEGFSIPTGSPGDFLQS